MHVLAIVVTKPEQIHWLTAQFASREMEAAYQASVFRRHLRGNVGGVILGLGFIALYIFSEFIDSPEPSMGVVTRLATVAISACLLLMMLNKRFSKHHDMITTIIILVIGVATNLNIWRQPTLDNTFYLGLIQGYIMFTLLLRLNFTSVTFILTVTQACFAAIVFGKNDMQNAILQSANTTVIAIICISGAYLLQRYQRTDFIKNRLIEKQNEQLKDHLAATKTDNKRKIAALNMLVHFVKTPLHQISGFSDILVSDLKSDVSDASADSARYIKEATANLTKSVNSLLSYHRLDELESAAAPEAIQMSVALEDFGEYLPAAISYARAGGADAAVWADQSVLQAALQALCEYYGDPKTGASAVKAAATAKGASPMLVFGDDGRVLSPQHFDEQTKPLTQFDGYLANTGEHMPMALRTVARAVEIMGGRFLHEPHADGNRFVILLPSEETKVAAA